MKLKKQYFLMVMENCRREVLMHTLKNKEKKNVIYDSLVLIWRSIIHVEKCKVIVCKNNYLTISKYQGFCRNHHILVSLKHVPIDFPKHFWLKRVKWFYIIILSNNVYEYQVLKIFIIKEKYAQGAIAAPGESNCFSLQGSIYGCHTWNV